MTTGTTMAIATGSVVSGSSAIAMNGSGAMLGTITMGAAVTGAMTTTAVDGMVTTETAKRGTTIDALSQKSQVRVAAQIAERRDILSCVTE
jgi:hypothetical protein